MQTLDWYYRRLKVMSPGEIAWRTQSSLRDRADRLLVGRRQRLRKPVVFLNGDGRDEGPCLRVSDMAVGDGGRKANENVGKQWYDSLMAKAEQIERHRLDLFDLSELYLGDPIYWHCHHKHR